MINILFLLVGGGFAQAEEKIIIDQRKRIPIAVRKVRNMAGSFAEQGVIEGPNGEKRFVGFWRPSLEIKLAEMLTTELANTGYFNVVERNNLYEVLEENSIKGIREKDQTKKDNLVAAKFIIIASLSDYKPNINGTRLNRDGRFLIITGGRDKTEVETYIAFDLRIINTITGEIVISRTIEGTTSSVIKAKRSGFEIPSLLTTWNLVEGGGEKYSYETTSANRALRAAMINTVDYITCQIYLKDTCIEEYEALDKKRREATKDSLDLLF